MSASANTSMETPNSRERQRLQTRAQILSAAIDGFARSGFEATSLAEVARRAGVKKALVQYHFATKEQLWKEAALLIWQQRNDFLRDILATPDEPDLTEQMRRGFVALVEFSLEHPQWLWFMFHEAAVGGDRQAWLLDKCLARDYRLGEAFVRQFQRQGLIREGSPMQLLHLISGALTYNLLVAPTTLRATGLDLSSREAIDEQVALLQQLLRP
ncbi:TetR/AcrR family transcriptional regulator [Seongchinamella sediminis]|nr:TetR/AcrR family transcriptional regulator [Seongchinamella sediminis]